MGGTDRQTDRHRTDMTDLMSNKGQSVNQLIMMLCTRWSASCRGATFPTMGHCLEKPRVNGVPREVPRQKPEGPQAPWVSAEGLLEVHHSP